MRDSHTQQHPAAARRTRSRLTAQIDPLTGWGRLHDGELLPPKSLTAVVKILPGRGAPVRLKTLTPADCSGWTWAALSGCPVWPCASCWALSTASAAASPVARGTATCTPPDAVERRMDLGYAVMLLLQQAA